MARKTGFKVLDAEVEVDRSEWLGLWDSWPEPEVFAHPSYVDLFRGESGHSICACWEDPQGSVLFPLIARSVNSEPWAVGSGSWVDLTGPYGYGGPYRWGEVNGAAFWFEFQRWAIERSVVSCFARLSLFEDGLLAPIGFEHPNGTNIIRSLDLEPDILWMNYAHKVRKNVMRAQREGLHIEVDLTGERLEDFLSIYYSTMDRREASQAYYFERGFFQKIIQALPGQFAFFHAIHHDTVVSTELVLVSKTHIYSFLGGTKNEAYDLRPNDFLKHEIILWGCRESRKAFVLGGGYKEDDGILRYKLAFAPNGSAPFRTLRVVFDGDAYDGLVATRAKWEAQQSRDWQPRSDFFPAYRSK